MTEARRSLPFNYWRTQSLYMDLYIWGYRCRKRFCLQTMACLRVEIYGEQSAIPNAGRAVFSGFQRNAIGGKIPIATRLAEIASGSRSQILREAYISDQLMKATELLDPGLQIFQIARLAFGVGRVSKSEQRMPGSIMRSVLFDVRRMSDIRQSWARPHVVSKWFFYLARRMLRMLKYTPRRNAR